MITDLERMIADGEEIMNKKEEKKENNISEKDEKPAEEKNYDVLWDKYLRLQADFDNYRKRSYKEKIEFIKYANEMLILELLDILDNFERGIKAADQKKDFDLLHQGVDMTAKQLHTLLESKGLKKIKAVGEKFDPHLHEPMEVVEEEGAEEDIVIEEMQSGYTLNNRIIRAVKVKVKKGKSMENSNTPQAAGSGLGEEESNTSQVSGNTSEDMEEIEKEDEEIEGDKKE
ncbi:MAG: nucleotide exchange factor GrpE [Candidatus Omnitrophota bacterium]